MSEIAKRCAATTKNGNPCNGNPVLGGDYCLAHSDEKTRDSVGFGGAQPGAGRPKNPKVVDMLRDAVEEQAELMLRTPFEAMAANRTVVARNGDIVGEEPDHQTRLRAWNDLLDRSYGRPGQHTEVSGPAGGPINIAHLFLSLDDIEEDLLDQETQADGE